jgi:hypothetical protein
VGPRVALAVLVVAAMGHAARWAVADKSKTDGFVLEGPGISKATGVSFTGRATWRVTLRAGKYVYGSLKKPSRRLSFLVSA